ncbi:ABC transporter ATP-binding protein [Corynebacterium doosanense]|uniref:Trehalose import ATP-binding protein SugC n=1 Tax=Corynebacterium doosanense CAU 212 = DSM 45436 TaxID=558173 RepID=A0A097IF42_9CORY|nr:ABC transporter ATP-binding protein [Corynebacterium doosanense]AIT60743.1 ABC transporter ATPase [Corynebacterium doosanense CAU 212 = DSM 45436]
MITLEDLSVTFPDGTVGLGGINLDVAAEEFVVLVGPSGSGKTTLLRTIAGFLTPSSGRLAIDGQDMTRVPPEKRHLGMVFQQHAVWPHMSVAGNVAYPLKRAGVPRGEIAKTVSDALELVGLAGYEDRRPDSLSGGQRQRVALARAVVTHPRVLLLDEALSALDEPRRDTLRRELVGLSRRQGLTTVHVTHDRAEALAIADRVVVLGDGRIQQIATPQELLQRPTTAEVASFISDAAVLPARIDGPSVTIDSLGITLPLAESEIVTGSGERVEVAVLPSGVSVHPVGTPGSIDAEVTSSLFMTDRYSLTVEAAGVRFRAWVSDWRPEIGERVGLVIRRPLVYAG